MTTLLTRTHRAVPLTRRPRVSVVIPLYNYGHFLRECVDSILTQEDIDVDVLIVDDASTDASLSVAQELAAADRRVRVTSNEQNIGMVPTINEGLWAVDGEYVVKLDADDLLTPGSLARSTALLDAHPSVGFVYGFPIEFTNSPPPPSRSKVRSWTVWSGFEWLEIRCQRGRNVIMQPEAVIRATTLHEAGKYNTELRGGHGSDFDMWLRLATIADVGRVNGAHQGYYRVHPHSMQRTVNAGHLIDLEALRDVFACLFDEAGPQLPDAPRMERMARRALALNAIDKACRAYDAGRANAEPVDDYAALALDVHTATPDLRQWRALQRRRKQVRRQAAPVRMAQVHRAWRDLADRVTWRRWRWSGL